MMSNPWGFDGTLINCGSMSPYTKSLFGWSNMVEITQTGNYSLAQSMSNAKVFVIRQGYPSGEYLIIENRQENGYDRGLSQPGLAIYHIDEKATNFGGYPQQIDFPVNHYIAALIQADGRFDLERMEDEGDSGDLFHEGRFDGIGPLGVILPDGSIEEGGNANTNSYQGGVSTNTGVTISNISKPSINMTFTVTLSNRRP